MLVQIKCRRKWTRGRYAYEADQFMLHAACCYSFRTWAIRRPQSVLVSSGVRRVVNRRHRLNFQMKRTINDYFGSSPTKKAKLTEPADGVHMNPIIPEIAPTAPKSAPIASPAQATPPATSSNELSPEEEATIENNRKKALSLQLLNKITEPSWKEALAGGTLSCGAQ